MKILIRLVVVEALLEANVSKSDDQTLSPVTNVLVVVQLQFIGTEVA